MKKIRPVVELHEITKKYQLYGNKPWLWKYFWQGKNRNEFKALDALSLCIYPGEAVALLGPNGCGKTTTLQVIAGISQPTQGKVKVRGKVNAIIDIAAGFNPELSGRNNIDLNGLLAGLTYREIKKHKEEIIGFSGLQSFIDEPLYTYSDGMRLRLGLAIALHSEADILLLDEGITAGDEAFKSQVEFKLVSLLKDKPTRSLVLSTHVFSLIKKLCTRLIWMGQGRIYKEGDLSLLKEYKKEMQKHLKLKDKLQKKGN